MSEEKWKEEARKEADILYITRPIKMAYIQGYLQACRVRQEDEIKLELAFAPPGGKFSGIVIGDHLIEDREVVEYIKKGQEEIKRLKEELASCQRELDRARGRGPRSWIEQRIVPE